MAIKLEDKQNVNAPNATFPFGDVKDNSGANDGTPLNRAVLSDYIQFFAKMMDASGIAFNDLLESDTDGFQYFDALIKNIRDTAASTTEQGTVERATQGEVDAGDATRYLTAALIAGATAIITNAALQDDIIDNDKLQDFSIDGPKLIDFEITRDKIEDGHVVKTPSGSPQLLTKVIEIGDWDMDSTESVLVTHGLTDHKKVREISVIIRDDNDSLYYKLERYTTVGGGGISGGVTQLNVNNISIARFASLAFDNALFDSTSFNRGWVTFVYEA